jgi:hypothetical protein
MMLPALLAWSAGWLVEYGIEVIITDWLLAVFASSCIIIKKNLFIYVFYLEEKASYAAAIIISYY